MELKLTKTTKIKEIKKQFVASFPFLKLEFFKHRHGQHEGSTLCQKIDEALFLPAVSALFREGVFVFDASMPVAAFEQRLQEEYGLSVQVFRKSGELWLETIQTDNLSLERQNEMGKAAGASLRFNIHALFL